MLCAICKQSFQQSIAAVRPNWFLTGYLHSSLRSFKDSVQEGCFICYQVSKHIAHQPGRGEKWLDNTLSTIGSEGNRWGIPLIMYTLSPYKEEYIIGWQGLYVGTTNFLTGYLAPFTFSPIDPHTAVPEIASRSISTADAKDLWSYWFRTCSESHPACREQELGLQPFVPRRLVEIHDSDGTLQWRLVCDSDIKTTTYLTLSHCWGGSTHLRLVQDKLACFQEKQPESDLPKTFRDAMRIALSLKVPYIWIDSLCIIQDSTEDWKSQSTLMGLIYQNAVCNIAASWGERSDAGCFSARPLHTRPDRSTTIMVDKGRGPEEYLARYVGAYESDITNAPLNTRGWVVQERYLARRQLSFAKSQVYWECLELTASEDRPEGTQPQNPFRRTLSCLKPGLTSVEEAHLRGLWSLVVMTYSRCALTKSSDKAVALAGLAGEMKSATNDNYLAGLWEKDIETQLLWKRYGLNPPRQYRMPTYIAPSWSWMSFDGPVAYDPRYGQPLTQTTPDHPGVAFVKVSKASIELVGPDTTHGFVSGTLELRGIAIWATATLVSLPAEYGPEYTLNPVGAINALSDVLQRPAVVLIFWDENVSSKQEDEEGWRRLEQQREQKLLFMFISTYGWQGLILEKVPGDENKFRRLGLFNTDRESNGRCFDLSGAVRKRLGLELITKQEDVNLDDERLKDLVHTVTIAVVYEGLRMRPVSVGLLSKQVPLGGDIVDGIFLLGGVSVGMNMTSLLRSKSLFGDDANLFRPERFLDVEGKACAEMQHNVDLTFGYGRWICAGKLIAMMELNKIYFEVRNNVNGAYWPV
ncbi:HET-domain-containing protein [Hypomontagnella monticulosa]|nr:HET-domain-containing protein [Hypomontagnella monticulosa]